MVQAELDYNTSGTINLSRTYYTMHDIERMMDVIKTSNQITFLTWKLGTHKNEQELEWVKKALFDCLNNPEKFDSPNDTFGAIANLREKIKRNNCIVLREYYGIPPKFEYRNSYEINAIVDANSNDDIIIPVTASEILDIIADINKNRSLEEIFDNYEFHHDECMTIELLDLFRKLYCQGKLNKIVRHICSKSNELGGFKDYGVEVIRNRLTSQYLFDPRRGGKENGENH